MIDRGSRGNRDRADGELNALLRRGIAAGRRVADTTEMPGERPAIEAALADLRSGDLLVIGVESIEETLAFLASHPATRGAAAPLPFAPAGT